MSVLADGKKVYDWPVPMPSVFFIDSKCVVYHAVFHRWGLGCEIMAYDLKGGKLLWRTRLKGNPPIGGSECSTVVRLERVNDEVLAVCGEENEGRYIEIVDMKTGKTVGHKVFPKKADGKDDVKEESEADPKAAAAAPLAKTDPPKPLPENIVKAWKAARAEVGWLRPSPSDFPEFIREKEGKSGDLPAFSFRDWEEGRLAKLPVPAQAFGLSFTGTQVTDEGLKGLAGLKSLQVLYLAGTQVTDAGLKELAMLKSLQVLDLYKTQVTDAGLKELAALKNLQFLDLNRTQITDVGLKDLAGLNSLQLLYLANNKVTDVGLKELAGLNSLQTLYLEGTQVTDAGLKELAGLRSLQRLDLSSTQVTGVGLKELTAMKSLQRLDLSSTPVTDAGLKELAGLKSLQELDLRDTQITDAGLKELAGLKSLQSLNLVFLKTPITDAGLKELQKALPKCRINWYNGPTKGGYLAPR